MVIIFNSKCDVCNLYSLLFLWLMSITDMFHYVLCLL